MSVIAIAYRYHAPVRQEYDSLDEAMGICASLENHGQQWTERIEDESGAILLEGEALREALNNAEPIK